MPAGNICIQYIFHILPKDKIDKPTFDVTKLLAEGCLTGEGGKTETGDRTKPKRRKTKSHSRPTKTGNIFRFSICCFSVLLNE